jgi:hypothetical protein
VAEYQVHLLNASGRRRRDENAVIDLTRETAAAVTGQRHRDRARGFGRS